MMKSEKATDIPVPKTNNFQHPKKRAFLAAHSVTGNVTKAAEAADIDRQLHYYWLKNDTDYAAAFNDTKGQYQERLEAGADRRAVEGVKEPIFDRNGKQVLGKDGKPMYRYKYSDILLMFRLKGIDPDKYAERRKVDTNVNHTGSIKHYNELTPAERERRTEAMLLTSALSRQLQTGAIKLLPGLPRPEYLERRDQQEQEVINVEPEAGVTNHAERTICTKTT